MSNFFYKNAEFFYFLVTIQVSRVRNWLNNLTNTPYSFRNGKNQ